MPDGYYDYYSENYPYNVVPQVKRPTPVGNLPDLACPPDFSSQFIIIDNNKLSVIKGYDTKTTLDLSEFFVPINESYQIYEFVLKYDGDFTKYVTLNYANISSSTDIKFIMLLPQYLSTEIKDQNNWYLHYRFLDDPAWTNTGINNDGIITANSSEDETTWRHLGKILMIDSSKYRMIKPILLQNRLGEDITIKIMIAF
jgi:hypothetical protein